LLRSLGLAGAVRNLPLEIARRCGGLDGNTVNLSTTLMTTCFVIMVCEWSDLVS